MANKEIMRTLYRRENNYEEVKENDRDLTNKILDYLDEGMSENEISKKLKISRRRISNLLKKKREFEEIMYPKKRMSKEEFISWAYKKGLISSK